MGFGWNREWRFSVYWFQDRCPWPFLPAPAYWSTRWQTIPIISSSAPWWCPTSQKKSITLASFTGLSCSLLGTSHVVISGIARILHHLFFCPRRKTDCRSILRIRCRFLLSHFSGSLGSSCGPSRPMWWPSLCQLRSGTLSTWPVEGLIGHGQLILFLQRRFSWAGATLWCRLWSYPQLW